MLPPSFEESGMSRLDPRLEPAAFRVTIHYREPTYELHAGPKADPYWWTFRIMARTAAEALKRAISTFREMESLSSVGWTREIVRTIVESA
jgi:hypothetical protein